MNNLLKALSLECLPVYTVAQTERNEQLFEKMDELDEKFRNAPSKGAKMDILAQVYDLCIIMDVI